MNELTVNLLCLIVGAVAYPFLKLIYNRFLSSTKDSSKKW